jgi:hypothetical protein
MEKREETIKNQKALIACQIKRSIKEDFTKKASLYGGTSLVLRELILAFNEGRLTIRKPVVTSSLYQEEEASCLLEK